jgi:hypothetical protein
MNKTQSVSTHMSDILLFTLIYTNTFYNLQVPTVVSLNLAQIVVFSY